MKDAIAVTHSGRMHHFGRFIKKYKVLLEIILIPLLAALLPAIVYTEV
jgi:hypothetical protein